MNKLGFTLIELLAVIAIIGLITIITNINALNIYKEKESLAKIAKEDIITTAACTYIELSENKDLKELCLKDGCTISSDILINKGLLDENDVEKTIHINIYKENNKKTCTLK